MKSINHFPSIAAGVLLVVLSLMAAPVVAQDDSKATSARSRTSKSPCEKGKIFVDSSHCCYPGQSWNQIMKRCAGVPTSCPTGMHARGETCRKAADCSRGQVVVDESVGACCYPGQTWSRISLSCFGRPKCPEGYLPQNTRCVKSLKDALLNAPYSKDMVPNLLTEQDKKVERPVSCMGVEHELCKALRQRLKRGVSSIRRCAALVPKGERVLYKSSLHINKEGRVVRVILQDAESVPEDIRGCMKKKLEKMRFPRGGIPLEGTYLDAVYSMENS